MVGVESLNPSSLNVKKIKSIENNCILQVSELNSVHLLIDCLEKDKESSNLSDESKFYVLGSVTRVFIYYAKNGYFENDIESQLKKAQVSAWLKGKFQIFCKLLLHFLELCDEPAVQVESWKCLLELLRIESGVFSDSKQVLFANNLYIEFVSCILRLIHTNTLWTRPLFDAVIQSLNNYTDLKVYFLKDFNADIFNDAAPAVVNSLYQFLSSIEPTDFRVLKAPNQQQLLVPLEFKKNKLAPAFQEKLHKKYFSACWLQFLRLPITPVVHSHVLQSAHEKLIPFMSQPAFLCDYFADSFNQGGVSSLLALQGLWTLMRDYSLEYPDFYAKLYSMLTTNLAHVRFRSRFLRMCDLFLSSTHIPAYVVASFAKKFSRLALYAPPAASIAFLPLVYNLFKRHPAILGLIHRPNVDGTAADTFNSEMPLSSDNGAMDSSLWEVVTLQKHYHPAVRKIALLFSQILSTQEFNLEDFLDLTHDSLDNVL